MINSQLSPQEAAEELQLRRAARRRLLDFTTYTYPQYQPDPFHVKLAETLDAVIAGDVKRLMIFAPPQHGKSELASVRLPALWLGKRPNDPIVLTSYAASLAEDKSRQVRQIIESNEYAALFGHLGTRDAEPITTRRDSRAVAAWHLGLPYRGGMRAAGVGGPITGHGGLLGIIDDPVENWEQGQSKTDRDKKWAWYRGTFRTRIWEGGAIVLIMTRWHEDDLAGRLLNTDGDDWLVLRFPALAETQEERDQNNEYLGLPKGESDPLGREPGEALSPKRFSATALNEMKKEGSVGSLAFAAEYQGVPRAAEGNTFKRHWFKIVDAAPKKGRLVRYWDKASTEGGTGAATAGVLILKADDAEFDYYILDVVRGWYSSHQREKIILQTAELDAQRYKSKTAVEVYIEQEPGSGGKDSAWNTIKNLAGYRIKRDLPSGDKDVRLQPFADQAEALNVALVRNAWNQDWIEEMVAIPNGARRDQADATAGAFNRLNDKKSAPKKVPVTGLWDKKKGQRTTNLPR